MNAHPVTYPGRRFVITSIVRIATVIVVAGALALTLAPLLARGQSGSAFVRVNQVGYATTASKRAYLMASGAEAGRTFRGKHASWAVVYFGPIWVYLGER